MSARTKDHAPVYRHIDDMDWETLRFPGQHSKMLFHPGPDEPKQPNAGLVKFEPGAHHPRHRHDFAQIWYIVEGTFRIGERMCTPGTVVYHSDPHYEEELRTESGGIIFIAQYPGPTTGKGPIYDGRFNVKQRKDLAEENLNV